jgi:hypothetical protein
VSPLASILFLVQGATPLPDAGLLRASKSSPPPTYVEASLGLAAVLWEGGDTELEFADVDGDGNPDLVTIGDHGSPFVNTQEHGIMTYFGDGAGSWSLFQNGNFGYGGIAAGDVDGDGRLDLAYGMHHDYSATDLGDQLIEAALGDGSGLAWTPWDDGLATSGETYGMFATDLADVDNDGFLDIGSNSFGCCAGIHVYRNEGDGTWTQTFGLLGGNAAAFFVFGDVDADGDADFVVSNSLGTAWLGDGQGGFANVDGNLPGTSLRSGLDLGDVDGDGREELAFAAGAGSLEVWRFGGGTSWTELSGNLPTSSPFRIVQIADMDADGRRDLAALGAGRFALWLRGAAGAWNLAVERTIQAGAEAQAFRAGTDVDHNGRPDFALVEDEVRNTLRFFREGSPAVTLSAFVAAPRGGETWKEGSVRRIQWYSAVPAPLEARASVDLSTSGPLGPWIPLAAAAPNNGELQITVPEGSASSDCFVRVRVRAGLGFASARNPLPFSIVP